MNRIKQLILIIICVTSANVTNAQLGAKIGVVSAKQIVSFSGIDANSDGKLGLQVGAFYNLPIVNNLHLRPTLQFTFKGGKAKDDNDEDVTANYNYIEIPIDIVYSIPMSQHTLKLHAGPYLGYAISAEDDGTDVSDEINKREVGYNLGLSFEFGKCGIGFNLSRALTNIVSEEAVPLFGDVEVKNKYTSLYFTYDF